MIEINKTERTRKIIRMPEETKKRVKEFLNDNLTHVVMEADGGLMRSQSRQKLLKQ